MFYSLLGLSVIKKARFLPKIELLFLRIKNKKKSAAGVNKNNLQNKILLVNEKTSIMSSSYLANILLITTYILIRSVIMSTLQALHWAAQELLWFNLESR